MIPRQGRNPLIETSRETARALLEVALVKEPRLTHFGIGIHEEVARRVKAKGQRDKLQELKREFQKNRKELSSEAALDEVSASVDWIMKQKIQKTFNVRHTSYGYKHMVEAWFRSRGHLQYVANGSFIAAAVGLGLEARGEFNSPNLQFKFSEKSVRALQRRA